MGKALIIKGADFSGVSIPEYMTNWFLQEFDGPRTNVSETTNCPYVPSNYAALRGKTINAIKLQIAVPGTVTIAVASALNENAVFSQERELDFTQNMPGDIVVKTFEPITISNSEYICIVKTTDTGLFNYEAEIGGTFYVRVGRSNYLLVSGNLRVNWGTAELVE